MDTTHRAHEPRTNRNAGVRRHRAPFLRLTGCERTEYPYLAELKHERNKAQRREARLITAYLD